MGFSVGRRAVVQYWIKIETAESSEEGREFRAKLELLGKKLYTLFRERQHEIDYLSSGDDRLNFEVAAERAEQVQALIDKIGFPRDEYRRG